MLVLNISPKKKKDRVKDVNFERHCNDSVMIEKRGDLAFGQKKANKGGNH